MSSAVRPMAVSPDERFIYYQVSFFHGLVEFDTQARDDNGTRGLRDRGHPRAPPRRGDAGSCRCPTGSRTCPSRMYVNDSAHHGLSMNPAGTKLCVAGTMDDYAAIVDRRTFKTTILDKKSTGHYYGKPYWTTEGLGNRCWISLSEADAVAVVDYATGKELAFLKVGDHPQRVRHGYVPERLVRSWSGTGVNDKPGESHPEATLLEQESEHSGTPQDAAKEAYAEASKGGEKKQTEAAKQRRADGPVQREVSLASRVGEHPATPWAVVGLALLLALRMLRRPAR